MRVRHLLLVTLLAAVALTAPLAAQQTQAPLRTPDVIFVPTPPEVVEAMLKLANVTGKDVVYDLGCGDGIIVTTAAQKYGARAVGIDIDPQRVKESTERITKAGVTDKVKILNQDLFTTNISEASVVTLYLLPSLNQKLIPKLNSELKPGTRIVSQSFDMKNRRLRLSGGRRRLMAVRRVVAVLVFRVLDGNRALKIDDRQEGEDVRLQPAGDQPQEHHRQRNQKRNQPGEDGDDQLLAEDVAEETQRQGHHPRQVADDLDDEHQRRHPHRGSRRQREVFHVIDDALLLDPLEVVVDPDCQGAPERDVEAARRRHEARNQPEVIREEDEDEQRADQRQILRPLRPDPLLQHPDHRADAVLHDDLEMTGVLDAEARAHEQAQRRQHRHDQHHHHQVRRDGLNGIQVKAQWREHRPYERPQRGVHCLHDEQRML